MAEILLTVQLVATLTMCGLIWFVQIVHYPLMAQVDSAEFTAYERLHQARTSLVVAGPMLAELAAAVGLFWYRPSDVPMAALIIGAVLVAVIWASTIVWQMPAHRALEQGFDAAAHRRLVRTNWVRTVAWTLRGALACWMCS